MEAPASISVILRVRNESRDEIVFVIVDMAMVLNQGKEDKRGKEERRETPGIPKRPITHVRRRENSDSTQSYFVQG